MDVFTHTLQKNNNKASSTGYTQKCLDRAIEKLLLVRKTNNIALVSEVIEELQVISPSISKNPAYEDLTSLIKDGRGC